MSFTRNPFALLTAILIAVLSLFSLTGCGKKEMPPVPVGQMTDYRDPGYGFRIQYPAAWQSNAEVGRAFFFSGQDVDKRFLDPDGGFPDGVLISVLINKATTPGVIRDSAIAQMKAVGYQVSAAEQLTVSDKPAVKYSYTARFNSGTMSGEHVYIDLDTLLYDINFAGFGDLTKAHKDVFAAVLKSFQLPKAMAKGADETLPSENYVDGKTAYFSYLYPENFDFGTPNKGSFEVSAEVHNHLRLDCSIRFDMFDAKGQNSDKVFDQNKGKYRAVGTGKATIGGEQASYITYAASKDVNARAYFFVHAGKAFRVTFTWFKPQEAAYLAVIEKTLQSVKFK